jgi:TM2 domain-containing membrane protein YozV
MRTKLSIFLFLFGIFISPVMAFTSKDVPKVRSHKQIKLPLFKKRRLKTEHNKWVAAGLDLSLGVFGVHRLYLGTETHVPFIYTLTLGGGGVLILADLGLILLSKDIETYSNSSHIFMWRKES